MRKIAIGRYWRMGWRKHRDVYLNVTVGCLFMGLLVMLGMSLFAGQVATHYTIPKNVLTDNESIVVDVRGSSYKVNGYVLTGEPDKVNQEQSVGYGVALACAGLLFVPFIVFVAADMVGDYKGKAYADMVVQHWVETKEI